MAYTRAALPPQTIRRYLVGFLFLTLFRWTQALDVSYCSPENQAGSNFMTSSYMSNGRCQDNCMSSYVFAVVQGQSCWCTDYIPADQVSTSECDSVCPGYPYELCGNPDQGLYAYFLLGGTPSGTAGGSSSPSSSASPTPTPTPSPTPSPSVSTTLSTMTTIAAATGSSSEISYSSRSFSRSFPTHSVLVPSLTSNVISQSSAERSTSSLRFSTQSSSTPPPPSTSDPTQVSIITSIVSASGSVKTVVVTQSPAQNTDSALGAGPESGSSGSGGLKGGTVAGIVVGVAIAIGLIIGGIVFAWLRRRHRKHLETAVVEGGSYTSPSHSSKGVGVIPSRQVSQLSSAGLLTKPSRANTGGLSARGDTNGPGTISSDRNSTHMTVDQRLNPWAIYSNEDSRASNVSLQDNHDYSRQLRVANPDQ